MRSGKMIFLDNAATTKPKFFREEHLDYWLNSNTPYAHEEQSSLKIAREQIKKCLGVKGGYILFFRCATEAIEWLFNKIQLMDMVCSPYEHDSVFNLADTVLDVCKIDSLKYKMLYCHQLVNQITGDVWYIHNIAQRLRSSQCHPQRFLGVDLTAAIGHVILPNDLEDYCDALWFSGHKFYTEKGIGAMWISDRLGEYLGASKDPKNQYDLVHGTVDVPGACMLAQAMWWISDAYDESYYRDLVTGLTTALFDNNISSNIISKSITKTYAINAIHLDGINADALQTYLASKDIYIGTAHSACSGESDYRILEAMGCDKKIASQTIRISFGKDNTVEDVKVLVNEIKKFKELF